MDYIELKFNITSPNPILDMLKQELGDIGFDSFEDHPESISAFIDKTNFSKKLFDKTISPYSSFFKSVDYINHPYQNWNELWESSFEPILINDDCLIRASFHSTQFLKYEIIIDPEMSFGTGHHETTRLISRALFDLTIENKRILDFGSGTGLLSILAEKLGAKSIDAIEIDSKSLNNSIKNAQKNNCNLINFINGSGSSIPNMAYDLLLVNINKNTIIKEFNFIKKTLKKDSVILFSGFFKEDIDSIEKLGQLNGLNTLYSSLENQWALVAMKYK